MVEYMLDSEGLTTDVSTDYEMLCNGAYMLNVQNRHFLNSPAEMFNWIKIVHY